MKLKRRLVVIVIALIFFILPIILKLSSSSLVQASSNEFVSQGTSSPSLLLFGYIGDAPPISEFTGSKGITGYCGSLSSYFERSFSVQKILLKSSERFAAFEKVEAAPQNNDYGEQVKDGVFAIECGPISKTRDRETKLRDRGGSFSETFLVTSTKILIKRKDLSKLKEDPLSIKIGVISVGDDPCLSTPATGATTSQIICSVYRSASSENFLSVKDRDTAINWLSNEKIGAFASDEVILKTIKKDDRLFGEDYVIYPRIDGFSREDYGIVFYNKKPIFDNLIDAWFNSDKDGLAAKRDLQRQASDSWILEMFSFTVSLNDVQLLIGGVLFLLLPLLAIAIFRWLLSLVQRIPAFREFQSRLRRRQASGTAGTVNNYINNVVNNIFCYVDRDVPIALIEKLAIQPRLQGYLESGIPREEAEERVAEELVQEARKDPVLYNLIKAAFDTVTKKFKEELDVRVGRVVTWVFDSLFGVGNDPS